MPTRIITVCHCPVNLFLSGFPLSPVITGAAFDGLTQISKGFPMAKRKKIKSYTAAINILGGPAVVAKALGVGYNNVHVLRVRDRLPPKYWIDVIALARKKSVRGITLKRFAELAKKQAA